MTKPDSLTKKIINKVLSLLVLIRYGQIDAIYRYYYRHTYYCQLMQFKYVIKDYVMRKKYKLISFHGEFTPELAFVLPFAYWHYQNGTLLKTQTSKYTRAFFFFSPNHEEKYHKRTTTANHNFEIPRILYSQNYNMKKWRQVPLKEHYRNNIYVYDKPILILANRYNMEWDGPPISFFSIDMLDFIINQLKDHYTIIYNRPQPKNITMDNSDIYDLNEFDWLAATHPEVILMEDLFRENLGNAKDFNHLQIMVYANANHFISVHGGTAALASYFGGINLVFSKKGGEHHFKCFEKLYPKLANTKILHAKNDDDVKRFIEAYFIEAEYAAVK